MSFTGFSDEIEQAEEIENAPFWPNINLFDFQAVYRLPTEYRKGLLIERLKLAMVWANRQLSEWQSEQEALGVNLLDNVPVNENEILGSDHPLVLFYIRTVSCRAKAELLSDYATMLRKSDAQNDALESGDTADKWYQFANNALNDLMGKPKIHAELL